MTRHNDEPVYEDFLDHHAHARRVGHHVLNCQPPYVVGICGSWGAGKTSFLRKLWAYLGGGFPLPDEVTRTLTEKEKKSEKKIEELIESTLKSWFNETRFDFKQQCKDRNGNDRQLELVWFNPWQHQFESSPMVALLHEIRDHLTTSSKFLNSASKVTKIGARALFDTVVKFGSEIGGLAGAPKYKAEAQLPTASSIIEMKRGYDEADFSARSASQRFRDYFESAIESVAGKDGLLVIFIDDLDRCEGDVAYRLLEALKLHLNTKNCIYVLGLDQQ
ncbi:MAG: P-loop NTPase fold protein, partial [Acidobacteriota bacterium]